MADSSLNFHDEESDAEVQEYRVRERNESLKRAEAAIKLGEVATLEEIKVFFEGNFVDREPEEDT